MKPPEYCRNPLEVQDKTAETPSRYRTKQQKLLKGTGRNCRNPLKVQDETAETP